MTWGKQLQVQARTTCSGLDVAELLLLLQDLGLGQVRVTITSGPSCSVPRWHLVTGGCLSPEGVFPSWKFGRHTCGKVTLLQTKQVETGVEVTMCEVPSNKRRHMVPFSMHHLAKQHMDQDTFIQEA